MTASLRLVVLVILAFASVFVGAQAGAHHSIGTCEEVGIWTKSQAARNGTKHWSYHANAYVGYVPPPADCTALDGTRRTNGSSTQHTSLYMKDEAGRCMETVAVRDSFGSFFVYGYGCTDNGVGDTSGDRSYVNIGNYYTDTVMLRMESRSQGASDTQWDHWVWLYDRSQWVYIGYTAPRSGRAYAWVESSGYNASVPHQTHLTGITGDGSETGMKFPCPATNDFDSHQAQYDTDYWLSPGRAKFVPATNAQDTCD